METTIEQKTKDAKAANVIPVTMVNPLKVNLRTDDKGRIYLDGKATFADTALLLRTGTKEEQEMWGCGCPTINLLCHH